MQFSNILYVATSQTYLRLDNETLRVEVERETRGPVSLQQFSAVARSCVALMTIIYLLGRQSSPQQA